MCVTLHLLTTFELFKLSVALSLAVIETISPFSCGQRQGVISSTCGCGLTARKFIKTVIITDFVLQIFLQQYKGECQLACDTLCHTCLICEAHLLRKLKNLCHGAAASLSYKYPAQRICCGSNRVLGLLGGRLLWREQFGAEPCMKPLYCLELPVLPERRGQLLFTRSHTYTVCVLVYSIACVCICIFFIVCVCAVFCGSTTWFSH